MAPIKVLQINAGSKNFGGVSSVLLNLYRNIDKNEVQFDFLTPNISTYTEYKDEIEEMGGSIYQMEINASSLIGKMKFSKALGEFVLKKNYDIVHINSGVLFFNYIAARTVRRSSQAKIIVHSHNNGGRSAWKEACSFLLKKQLAGMADLCLACSNSAAEYMFDKETAKETIILNNGIETNKFRYNPEVRKKLRKKYNIDDRYVIGHVGRFMTQKNHSYIIDLFKSCLEREPDSFLILIGDGELKGEIEEKVYAAGLGNKVLFLGSISNVNEWYQAMDVFVLPSLYEGFGIVNIEAQTSGLYCIVSDSVPVNVDVTGHLKRLSLSTPITVWRDYIIEAKENNRIDCSSVVEASGYSIASSAKKLTQLYFDTLNTKE